MVLGSHCFEATISILRKPQAVLDTYQSHWTFLFSLLAEYKNVLAWRPSLNQTEHLS